MEYRMFYIGAGWEHHSPHSGFESLFQNLGQKIDPIDKTHYSLRWIPGRVFVWLAARSGMTAYSYLDFFKEWGATVAASRNSNKTICHVLSGDTTYRYLGSLARIGRFKVVATYHQPPLTLSKLILHTDHIGKLDALTVVGRNQIPFFENLIERERIFWIPLGVNTSVFRPSLRSMPLKTNGTTCLFVGEHKRDYDTLREVIKLVRSSDKSVRFVLVIPNRKVAFFDGVDGVEVHSNISESEIITLYQNADLLLLPLIDNTANTALVEAMACGLPVVISDVGSVRDYLDESCGSFVPKGNAIAMAEIVLQLLTDASARRTMSVNARARAEQLDWAFIAEKMHRVYSYVVS